MTKDSHVFSSLAEAEQREQSNRVERLGVLDIGDELFDDCLTLLLIDHGESCDAFCNGVKGLLVYSQVVVERQRGVSLRRCFARR